MPMTSLKRSGQIDYEAMITGKLDRPTWPQPSLLLRCTERNGVSTLFIVTNENTIQHFQTLEQNTIYSMQINGRCVRNNIIGLKFGVRGEYEVRLQFRVPIGICKNVWPLQLNYDLTRFTDLLQCDHGKYVDVFGRLLAKRAPLVSTSLPKLILTLTADGLKRDVQLLGTYATFAVDVGDMVAIKDALVQTYNGEKIVQTAFLSIVQVNPNLLPAFPAFSEFEGEPPRKAMKVELKTTSTIEHANQILKKMLADVEAGISVPPMDLLLRGKIHTLDNDFFVKDASLVGGVDSGRVRRPAVVSDITGDIRVMICTVAALELFLVSSKHRLREICEDGDRNEKNRDELLKMMNAHLGKWFLLRCTAKICKGVLDVNVNNTTED